MDRRTRHAIERRRAVGARRNRIECQRRLRQTSEPICYDPPRSTTSAGGCTPDPDATRRQYMRMYEHVYGISSEDEDAVLNANVPSDGDEEDAVLNADGSSAAEPQRIRQIMQRRTEAMVRWHRASGRSDPSARTPSMPLDTADDIMERYTSERYGRSTQFITMDMVKREPRDGTTCAHQTAGKTKEERAFCMYRGGAPLCSFDWHARVAGQMFPSFSLECTQALLGLPFIERFCITWMPYSHDGAMANEQRSLYEWKIMVLESCGHIDSEQFHREMREYSLEVTFREMDAAELQELQQCRTNAPGQTIARSEFAAYVGDFVRVAMTFTVASEHIDACSKSYDRIVELRNEREEALVKLKAQHPDDHMQQTAKKSSSSSSSSGHGQGFLDPAPAPSDMEVMEATEAARLERLAMRNRNDVFIQHDTMRTLGCGILMSVKQVCFFQV